MILLVTPSERASECAKALHEATGEGVAVAESLSRAAALLRAECYRAVVLDQYLLETEPHETETTLEHLGTAILVQVNLAVTGMERLLREVRAAMQRRQRDEVRARQAALAKLQSELNGTITALLLSSELALATPDLRPAAAEKLHSIHELVKKLRQQLESAGATGEPEPLAHV
jgi:signal transduction histidine kinase